MSEPTEREVELIREIFCSVAKGGLSRQVELIRAYAAEVRAALQDEHEHDKAEAYLNGREFERARWEGEVKEAIDLLDKLYDRRGLARSPMP